MAFICDTAMNTTHVCNVCMWWFLTSVEIGENLLSKQIYNCAFFDLVPGISAKHTCSLLLNQPLHKNPNNMRWQQYSIKAEFNYFFTKSKVKYSSYSNTVNNISKDLISYPVYMYLTTIILYVYLYVYLWF